MIIPNGQELAQFLGGEGESAGGRLPNIILLDLILPGKEGFEILQDIKNETRLAAIPVIILTESNVDRSYVLGANMFVSCLAGFEDLVDVVQSIEQFWLSVVALPRH
ncbi:MAG TPA: response regulator [Candidatus Lokiarchaeia archaeon]|nr:response regulator [Candidatus Lokiarchaeia archaeon]